MIWPGCLLSGHLLPALRGHASRGASLCALSRRGCFDSSAFHIIFIGPLANFRPWRALPVCSLPMWSIRRIEVPCQAPPPGTERAEPGVVCHDARVHGWRRKSGARLAAGAFGGWGDFSSDVWGALRAVGEIRFARGAGDASASCTRPGALLVRKTQALSPASGPALHLCLSARGRSSSRGRTRCRQASRILACAPHEGAAGVCRRSLRESPVRAPDRTASLIRDLSSRFLALFPLRREGGSDTRSGRQHALPRERDFAGGAGGVRSCRSASDAGAGPLRRTRSVANARSKDAVWRTL